MKFYSFPGSCSTTVHIALLEAGLDFEYIIVDLRSDRRLPDGRVLSDINPKNCVPVLELDDESILTEAPAILTYIGDLKPEANLIPPYGTMERVRFVEMLTFLSSDVNKTFRMYRLTEKLEEGRKEVNDRFEIYFHYLDSILADNKYLSGNTFTALDAYLIQMLDGAPKYFNYDLSPYSHICRYIEDLGEIDSVQKARKAVDEYIPPGYSRLSG